MKKHKEEMCCKSFLPISKNFGWYQFTDNEKQVFIMPYINQDGIQYRVNNCLSCGKEVRDIHIDPKLIE